MFKKCRFKLKTKEIILIIIGILMSVCLSVFSCKYMVNIHAINNNLHTTSNKDLIKEKIFKELQNYQTSITFNSKECLDLEIVEDTETDPKNIYFEVLYEHPEIFWTTQTAVSAKNTKGEYTIYITNLYDKSEIDSKKKQLNSKIYEIVYKFSAYDDLRKVYEIHDYVDKNISYNYDISKKERPLSKININENLNGYINDTRNLARENLSFYEAHSIYGALINKTAVCEGYAKSTKILLNKSNIESEIIRSDTHAWNYVKIKDKYYQIDTTWDDYNNEKNIYPYKYFNITNDEITKDTEKNGRLHTATSFTPNCIDTTFDNIFRSIHEGNLEEKNVVRIEDKLYGIEQIGENNYNLYKCNLDGTNKVLIKSNSNMYYIENVYAYNDNIYYLQYGLKNNKLYININKYNIKTELTTQFIDFLSEFGRPVENFNVDFYIKNDMMSITLTDSKRGVTKIYPISN